MRSAVSGAELLADREPVPGNAGGPAATKRTKRSRRISGRRVGLALSRLLPFIVIVGVWELASVLDYLDPVLVPSASAVARTLWDGLVVSQTMWTDVSASFYRAGVGLVLGVVLGAIVGLLMGTSRIIAHFVDPIISFTFPMPKLALLPLLILWLGIGDPSKIAMILLGAFFPMVVNTYAGVKGVSRVLIWNARTLGANRGQLLWRVVLPSAMPHVFSGIRIAAGTAFLLVVAAEMIASNDGLGFSIMFSQRNFRPDIMIAGILVVAALGFVIDRLISLASRKLLVWQDTSDR